MLAGHPVDWMSLLAAVSGTALAAAAANTFNQIYEAPLDALMKRTQGRPLPTGRLTQSEALTFGIGATAASAAVLYAGTNSLTLALGMGNIALYAGVYTPLKQLTTLNTSVGAVVGAIPPLMGWAAATGGLESVDPYLLSYILFAWQFPHFYALAWPLRKDYARGGYAMVPVYDTSGSHTARLISRHAMALACVPLGAAFLGVASPMFAVEGLVINAYFLSLTRAFSKDPSDANARAIFKASLWYLPLLLILFVFHANHWLAKEEEVRLNDLVGPPLPSATVGGGSRGGGLRGVGWGDALENGIGTLRWWGRELCLHELVSGVRGPGEERRELLGGCEEQNVPGSTVAGKGKTSGSCPVLVAESVAEETAELARVVSVVASSAPVTHPRP